MREETIKLKRQIERALNAANKLHRDRKEAYSELAAMMASFLSSEALFQEADNRKRMMDSLKVSDELSDA